MQIDGNRVFGIIIFTIYTFSIYRGIKEGKIGVTWNDSADINKNPIKYRIYFILNVFFLACGAVIAFGPSLPSRIFG